MRGRRPGGPWKAGVFTCGIAALVLVCPARAFADATAFIGVNTTPSNRTAKGFAIGITVLVVGVEFEYSNTGEDLPALAPSLTTFSGNALVQTPIPIAGFQFYGTAGVGGYRERLDIRQETNVSANVGGGAKISLLGPIKLRLDYRLFTLKGSPLHDKVQRVYAGLNLAF
jgi:opacity protein-like surface antigen